MSQSWSDWVYEQVGMLPFHLTGLSAFIAAVEVVSDAAQGNAPKVKDVVSAAGLVDAGDHASAISDALVGIAVDEALDRLAD